MIGTRTAPIRLALTLLGFPYCICTAGVRPLTHCSADASVGSGTSRLITASSAYNHFCTTTSGQTMLSSAAQRPAPHIKSRCSQYPGSQIKRFPVPDDKVDWTTDWPQYTPVNHTAPSVTSRPPWADPDIGSFSPRFNALDGAVDRGSFEGNYRVEQGKPLNPRGRTGLTERGLLGRWGPNHAADPIVTRWKLDAKGQRISHPVSKRAVLQFVAIKRKDCGEWAIPGGMVDPGELVSLTLQREFSEEALNSLKASPSERANIHTRITELFNSPGFQVYQGYVDDPRNTDNAWMETVAVNFHDDTGNSVSGLPLEAGDDAGKVRWVDVDSSFPLYASHNHFLEAVAKERNAHW